MTIISEWAYSRTLNTNNNTNNKINGNNQQQNKFSNQTGI